MQLPGRGSQLMPGSPGSIFVGFAPGRFHFALQDSMAGQEMCELLTEGAAPRIGERREVSDRLVMHGRLRGALGREEGLRHERHSDGD